MGLVPMRAGALPKIVPVAMSKINVYLPVDKGNLLALLFM